MSDDVGPQNKLQLIIAMLNYFLHVTDLNDVRKGVPCIFEGHLKTNKNWYGFLANITIVNTGRMTYEFVYPADVCCPSIHFIHEEQTNILNARMNCWQKENLGSTDLVLRLTPTFLWSGCHLVHYNGLSKYICEGGRSFVVRQLNGKPESWSVAVSNCGTLYGLNLQYRLFVYGHVGECNPDKFLGSSQSLTSETFPVAKPVSTMLGQNSPSSTEDTCVIKGEVNTTENWHGFITNTSVASGGGLRFEFSYPFKMEVQNVILYGEESVSKIHFGHDCWQKEGLIRQRFRHEQVLELSLHSSLNGCILKNISATELNFLFCKGERRYHEPRRIYIAVSNCKTQSGLFLNYHIETFGFTGDICSKGHFCFGQFLYVSLAIILSFTLTNKLKHFHM